MKTDIHPTYYKNAKVTCVCGRTFEIGSTAKEITVEICSACHPFYTGVEKIVDTAGRVEKFKARTAAAKTMAGKRGKGAEPAKKTVKKKAPSNTKSDSRKSGTYRSYASGNLSFLPAPRL